MKELKAFQRVSLLAGETKTVKFELPVNKLSFYDVTTNSWLVEKNDYQVLVGAPANGLLEDTISL